jgi:hypothetical protein
MIQSKARIWNLYPCNFQLSGLNIAQSNFGACQAVASIFVFSISSPIGIGIGMVLVNMEKSLAGDIANGILQVCT